MYDPLKKIKSKLDRFNYSGNVNKIGIEISRGREYTNSTVQRVHTLISWMQKVCAIGELVLNTGGGNVGCWLR